jgi:hypothetical protein
MPHVIVDTDGHILTCERGVHGTVDHKGSTYDGMLSAATPSA